MGSIPVAHGGIAAQHAARILPFSPWTLGRVRRGIVSAARIVLPPTKPRSSPFGISPFAPFVYRIDRWTQPCASRGEGVPVIVSASRRQSGISPEYRLSGDAEHKLTVFSAPVENRGALAGIAANLSSGGRGGLQTSTDGIRLLGSDNGGHWEVVK